MLIFVISRGGITMHIDEQKKFDVRNIARNIKNGIITEKDCEIYLSKLLDVSDKIFNPEESLNESKNVESKKDSESPPKKKETKKRTKGKAK
jgi:hypothetical protein